MYKNLNSEIVSFDILAKLNLLEIFLKESIIFETIKGSLPREKKEKDRLITEWFKKFNMENTKELIDFPIKEFSNQNKLLKLIIRKSLWINWCKDRFKDEILIQFNENKSKYDLITYQLIRTKNKNLSNELFFKLTEENQSFDDLSLKFSQGKEKYTNGIIGPVRSNLPHPKLVETLKNSSIDVINPTIEINGWWIICKLKNIDYAKLDDLLEAKFSLQLGNNYINSLTKDICQKFIN